MKSAYRGTIFHFLDNPENNRSNSYQYIEDGLLIVDSGIVAEIGEYDLLKDKIADQNVTFTDYSGFIIMPGFIDSHVHFPQLEMISSYSGGQLLEWLQKCVFPTEHKYSNPDHVEARADIFLRTLLKNGTTSALTLSASYKCSADILFKKADRMNMRLINGKVLMDRNAPEYLLDTPESAYEDSKALIEKWHKKGRQLYSVTPRFAPTSTEAQLEVVTALKKEFPDVYIHTHLSENKNEVEWVKQLFPWSRSYTDVYERFGLTGNKSVFAHCAQLTDEEFKIIRQSNSTIAWCPSANFFLGSGVYDINKSNEYKIKLAIGSDVGGGNNVFLLHVLDEAYKVAAIQKYNLHPLTSFYQITLGNARALSIDKFVGNLQAGKEADFVVINPAPSYILKQRMSNSETLSQKLFCLQMLADNRIIKATYVAGIKRFENSTKLEENFIT